MNGKIVQLPLTPTQATELAYGLLWMSSGYEGANTGLLRKARMALLSQLDREGQRRGIIAARAAVQRDRETRRLLPIAEARGRPWLPDNDV